MSATPKTIKQSIDQRQYGVGIIGLGYVGLPLALAFAEKGFRVLGFDTDPQKIEALRRGESYIQHIESSRLVLNRNHLEVTSDEARLGEPDALLICVPTPLTAQREPDLQYVEATVHAIVRYLRKGQLVVLESTTWPGTTEEMMVPLLEARGLQSGEDFFVAFSPEREDPGNPNYGTTDIPKVVGGVGESATQIATALYEAIVDRVVGVSSPRVAEATKLTENIFRSVNIALVNELKMIYDRMGIDIWEVLDASETKPFGFMRFNPGPGLGGHCIPIDPFYLSWKAREYGMTPKFVELAGEINISMPGWVMEKIQKALNHQSKPIKGSRVLIIGIAYKPNVADPRESPAFEIIDQLLESEAQVSYHDPHIPIAPSMRSWIDLPPLESVPLDQEVLEGSDLVVIVTGHQSVDWDLVAEHAKLVVDTRGILKPSAKVIRA